MRTISASFAITGADSVTDVLGEAQGGAPTVVVPDGWRVEHTLAGVTDIAGVPVSLRGVDEIPAPTRDFT